MARALERFVRGAASVPAASRSGPAERPSPLETPHKMTLSYSIHQDKKPIQ
jgi:hypothetical protein